MVQFRGLNLLLKPTVFHPSLYLTTETLLDYLLTIDLNHKSVLELGCGSGAISLYLASKMNVSSYASDINPSAIDGLIANCEAENLEIRTFNSDLFDSIPLKVIDVVILNPPFFNNPIKSVDEYAFNTGEDFQYFKKLSRQLLERKNYIGEVYMILTDKCDLESILSYFDNSKFKKETVHDVVSLGERHYIYNITFL